MGAGNRIFQIRAGNYTLETIIDYDNTWDVLSLSEAAQRFFLGIRAEIERDPNIKHAIITYQGIIPYLEDFSEKENVCLVSAFNETRSFESTLKEVDVLWVVGTPVLGARHHLAPLTDFVWQRRDPAFLQKRGRIRRL